MAPPQKINVNPILTNLSTVSCKEFVNYYMPSIDEISAKNVLHDL